MAVAFVALLAALSGTAVALPGTNRVDSGDLKNNSVRGADVRNNGLTGADIRDGSIGGADITNDGLTGDDLNESTLGTVPSANAATSANTANTANSANTANTASSAGNANALGGTPAGEYTKAVQFAYGEISTAGAVLGSPPNRNIASVSKNGTGVYCLQLAFNPTFGQGSATGASGTGLVVQPDIPASNCPAGTEATVYLVSNADAFVDDEFQVLFGGF